jgi:hypothetical protein
MADHPLYYPYIHIQDPDWLKATLLIFSQVRRMTPVQALQAGDDALSDRLRSGRVEESQCSLAPNFGQGERWRPKSNLRGVFGKMRRIRHSKVGLAA